jgi:hypothetical protein
LIFELRSDGSAAIDSENHDVLKMRAGIFRVEPGENQFCGFGDGGRYSDHHREDQKRSFQFGLPKKPRT